MIKIFLIDNYDSFTYNVFNYFSELGCNVTVARNDKFKINQLKKFDKIVISPGPGNPDNAGLCLEVVDQYFKKKPIFGICLGHQIIAQAFGGKIIKAKKTFVKYKWPIIDVTRKSVEETAASIIKIHEIFKNNDR